MADEPTSAKAGDSSTHHERSYDQAVIVASSDFDNEVCDVMRAWDGGGCHRPQPIDYEQRG